MCIDKRIENGDNQWSIWAVFLRSLNGEQKLNYIDRVQFNLHSDFPDPVRVIYQEPFETAVFGYLECNAYITIFFKDPEIPPQLLQVKIKFNQEPYQKVIMRENIIFIKPSLSFYNILKNYQKSDVYSAYLNHLDPKLFKKLHPNARCVNYESGKSLSQLYEQVEKEQFIDSQHASEYGLFLIDDKMIEKQQTEMRNHTNQQIEKLEKEFSKM